MGYQTQTFGPNDSMEAKAKSGKELIVTKFCFFFGGEWTFVLMYWVRFDLEYLQ